MDRQHQPGIHSFSYNLSITFTYLIHTLDVCACAHVCVCVRARACMCARTHAHMCFVCKWRSEDNLSSTLFTAWAFIFWVISPAPGQVFKVGVLS